MEILFLEIATEERKKQFWFKSRLGEGVFHVYREILLHHGEFVCRWKPCANVPNLCRRKLPGEWATIPTNPCQLRSLVSHSYQCSNFLLFHSLHKFVLFSRHGNRRVGCSPGADFLKLCKGLRVLANFAKDPDHTQKWHSQICQHLQKPIGKLFKKPPPQGRFSRILTMMTMTHVMDGDRWQFLSCCRKDLIEKLLQNSILLVFSCELRAKSELCDAEAEKARAGLQREGGEAKVGHTREVREWPPDEPLPLIHTERVSATLRVRDAVQKTETTGSWSGRRSKKKYIK